jgi:hypothetical protein
MFELDDARRDELVERWSAWIHQRGFAVPAIFLLEAHKPLSGLSAQATIAFRPLIEGLSTFDATELAAFMREPDNVERLIRRLEQLVEETDAKRKAAQARRRWARRRARRIRSLRRRR